MMDCSALLMTLELDLAPVMLSSLSLLLLYLLTISKQYHQPVDMLGAGMHVQGPNFGAAADFGQGSELATLRR